MKPKSLLDPSFRYTPSFSTNVKSTFDRIRRELRAQAKAGHALQAKAGHAPDRRNVVSINSPLPRLQATSH